MTRTWLGIASAVAVFGTAVGGFGVTAASAQTTAGASASCGTNGVFSQAGTLDTCSYSTVGADTFTAPSGVTSLSIVAVGGGGGGGNSAYGASAGAGGSGAKVSTTLAVSGNQVLDLFVGGGGLFTSCGVQGGSGGGSTTIDPTDPADRVIAGGGGGGGINSGSGLGSPPAAAGGSGGGAGGAGGNGIGAYGGLGGSGGTGGSTGLGGYDQNGGNGDGGSGGGISCEAGGAGYGGGGNGGGFSGSYGGGGGGFGGGSSGHETINAGGGGGAGGSTGPSGVTSYAPAGNGGAASSNGGNGSIVISWTPASTAPTITSGDSATFTVGQAGSFTVTASGFPAPSLTESGTLPGGVTFDNGVLSGTPAAGSGGKYQITFTASNAAGAAQQNFILTVDEPPAISSAKTATFAEGQKDTFTVTTTGYPATITETGALAPGVTFSDNHNGTATLSGTPSATGSFPIAITDTNPAGKTTQAFTLVVVAPLAITGSLPGGTVGVPYNAQLTATGGTPPYTWSVVSGSLPPGLSLAADGTVSGTPTTAGTYPVTIQVGGPATKAMTLVIAAAPIPASITPAPVTPASITPAPATLSQASPSPAASSTEPLAVTGTDIPATVGSAIALLLVGGGLVVSARRRRPLGKHAAG